MATADRRQVRVGDTVTTYATAFDKTDRSITATVGTLSPTDAGTTLFRLDSDAWLQGYVYRARHEFTVANPGGRRR